MRKLKLKVAALSVGRMGTSPEIVLTIRVIEAVVVVEHASNVEKRAICLENVQKEVVGMQVEHASNVERKATSHETVRKVAAVAASIVEKRVTFLVNVQNLAQKTLVAEVGDVEEVEVAEVASPGRMNPWMMQIL